MIYCVTPAQYDVRYITLHPDNRLTSRCLCAGLLGTVDWQEVVYAIFSLLQLAA